MNYFDKNSILLLMNNLLETGDFNGVVKVFFKFLPKYTMEEESMLASDSPNQRIPQSHFEILTIALLKIVIFKKFERFLAKF